ncbi:class I fructose-bisphosphate aldolase [Mycobacterium sp. ENV421]|uniref:class I fructose-bisphosphate aldolase n=1 Tax=Mycobacterium sp. ENV421 TaxID=1213407 RepID=UPI0018EA997E
MIDNTPGLSASISGVILCNETIRQRTSGGQAFATVLVNAGIVPGIKVERRICRCCTIFQEGVEHVLPRGGTHRRLL